MSSLFTPPRGYHTVMVLPDLHIPYQDDSALECVLQAHALIKPKRTVILGDWIDCASFSTHPPRNLLETLAADFKRDEIDPCNRVLDILQENTHTLVYIEGNHEDRVNRAVASALRRSPLTAVHELISPRTLLSEGRRNFIWIDYGKDPLPHYCITPDLWAFHGFTHSQNAADSTVKKLISVSGVFGHIHRAQSAAIRNKVDNKVIKAWSPGCLSKLQPLYATSNTTDWVHGFSIIYVKNDESAWFDFDVRIVNGVCMLPGGKEIRV